MIKFTGIIDWLLCLFLFACLSNPAATDAAVDDELDASRQRLDKIERQIEQTLKGLRSKEKTSGALADELENLGVETRRIERLMKNSRQQLTSLSAQLEQQRKVLSDIESQLEEKEQQIRQRLVILYKTGEVGLIKTLLSESESPYEISEKYAFLSRMVRHDRELLASYRQQSQDHKAAVNELEALREKQSIMLQRRRDEQEALQKALKNKKIVLAGVRQDAKLLERMVEELRAKATRLNELVKRLETEQSQPYTESLDGFVLQKGRLNWPVPGELRVGFGTSRHGDLGTLIESHGFDIATDVGTPVHAAAPGTVIFANSLRGYGNLIIIDHGNKFYTLYAHVARFTKQVGDSAKSDEVIAYSGYEGRDAVYFEIRQGGKPLDPADWLRAR
jgi:septal ring factor EnvC (AmiA/AmiB activator)